jgi:signal transduction histidine kinase
MVASDPPSGPLARKHRGVQTASDARAVARPRLSLLHIVLALSVAAVALVFARPAVSEAPGLRAAVETVMTLFALAGAWLVRSHFIYTRRLRDLLLFGALLALGLLYLGAYAVPAAVDVRSAEGFAETALWGELLVAALFVAAALEPKGVRFGFTRDWLAIAIVLSGAAMALSALLALLLGVDLYRPGSGVGGQLRRPLGLVLVLAATGLLVRAGIGFARRGRIERDDVASMLAGAAILLAAARVSQLALPWLAPDEISATEAMRLAACSLVLVAALRQELHTRAMVAREASRAERRRVARDLHDGLAQDLALIAAHGERIAGAMGAEHPVVIAARRALDISRYTISELSDPPGATVREALEAVARELGDRFEISIVVDIHLDREPSPDVREHLSRIVREAIANAARHGRAENVLVSLKRREGTVTLRVRDDGRGIDGAQAGSSRDGFGMRAMRERAEAMGAQFAVSQTGASGTELDVVLQ